MLTIHRMGAFLLAGLLMATGASGVVLAQEPADAAAQSKTAQQPAKSKSGDGDLRKRVEQLEEQIVDMQVVIGTLESLARGGAGTAAAARPGGADTGRIVALEAQVRALQAKIDQLPNGGRTAVVAPPASTYAPPSPPAPPADGGFAWQASPTGQPADATPPAPGSPPGSYGSTTVNSGTSDDIGSLIEREDVPPVTATAPAPAPGPLAALDGAPVANPKQDYEKAYGFLLQQNYGAAQAGFTDFLKQYPKDSLVPNALYWLGETHYVQRNYSDAAEAFDIVTQAYGSSSKAPDSYLKRGMALAQLGKTQDACGMLSGLNSKYPSAPANVKAKADSERQRLGCS